MNARWRRQRGWSAPLVTCFTMLRDALAGAASCAGIQTTLCFDLAPRMWSSSSLQVSKLCLLSKPEPSSEFSLGHVARFFISRLIHVPASIEPLILKPARILCSAPLLSRESRRCARRRLLVSSCRRRYQPLARQERRRRQRCAWAPGVQWDGAKPNLGRRCCSCYPILP